MTSNPLINALYRMIVRSSALGESGACPSTLGGLRKESLFSAGEPNRLHARMSHSAAGIPEMVRSTGHTTLEWKGDKPPPATMLSGGRGWRGYLARPLLVLQPH